MKNPTTYLGDGLYAKDDGFMFTLHCEREEGTHYVGLEDEVVESFLRFIEQTRNVIITVKKNVAEEGRTE